jgi:hypothetical protein
MLKSAKAIGRFVRASGSRAGQVAHGALGTGQIQNWVEDRANLASWGVAMVPFLAAEARRAERDKIKFAVSRDNLPRACARLEGYKLGGLAEGAERAALRAVGAAGRNPQVQQVVGAAGTGLVRAVTALGEAAAQVAPLAGHAGQQLAQFSSQVVAAGQSTARALGNAADAAGVAVGVKKSPEELASEAFIELQLIQGAQRNMRAELRGLSPKKKAAAKERINELNRRANQVEEKAKKLSKDVEERVGYYAQMHSHGGARKQTRKARKQNKRGKTRKH